MSELRVISADSHVQEDPRLYQERVPKKFRHRVPHIEEVDGGTYWITEGKKPRRIDVSAQVETERRPTAGSFAPIRRAVATSNGGSRTCAATESMRRSSTPTSR